MQKITAFIFLNFLVAFTTVSAQKTEIYNHQLAEFDKAISLYDDKQYLAAQILFDRVKQENNSLDVQSDCAYYIAFCAIKLNQSNAEQLMEKFVEEYPTSSKQNQAYIGVSQHYFAQGNYPQALQYFDKVDESGLTYEELEKFFIKSKIS